MTEYWVALLYLWLFLLHYGDQLTASVLFPISLNISTSQCGCHQNYDIQVTKAKPFPCTMCCNAWSLAMWAPVSAQYCRQHLPFSIIGSSQQVITIIRNNGETNERQHTLKFISNSSWHLCAEGRGDHQQFCPLRYPQPLCPYKHSISLLFLCTLDLPGSTVFDTCL